jgi:transcriptional regulator with XRE-family HTH domain
MKLGDYLAENRIPRSKFAELIGVSGETVRRYIAGARIPERDVMERIALATAFQVTANDFFGIAA